MSKTVKLNMKKLYQMTVKGRGLYVRTLCKRYGLHLETFQKECEKEGAYKYAELDKLSKQLAEESVNSYLVEGVHYTTLDEVAKALDVDILYLYLFNDSDHLRKFFKTMTSEGVTLQEIKNKLTKEKTLLCKGYFYADTELMLKVNNITREEYLVIHNAQKLGREIPDCKINIKPLTQKQLKSKNLCEWMNIVYPKGQESLLLNHLNVAEDALKQVEGYDFFSRLDALHGIDNRKTFPSTVKVAFDIDGTVTNNQMLYDCLALEYKGFTKERCTRYDLSKMLLENGFIKSEREYSNTAFFTKYGEQIFTDAQETPYAVSFIKWLLACGVDVHFITSRVQNEESRTKEMFKRLNLPYEQVHHIGCVDKATYAKESNITVLFEDRASTLRKATKEGIEHLILIAHPYNEYLNSVKRISDFSNMKWLIEKLER